MVMLQNNPDIWRDKLPVKRAKQHKYDHGHALIYGAPAMTGATRLSATACARMGAGLVSVLATPKTQSIYQTALPPHIIVRDNLDFFDDRVSARLYGPGGLPCEVDFDKEVPTILDADALKNLPSELGYNYVLTPHEGEFSKAFPHITGTNAEKTKQAALELNCYVVLKGSTTYIAGSNGDFIYNEHSSPWLGTAGTGDVLAGMITGLAAQKMPLFDAACAAVWMHGEAALKFGSHLVAPDLLGELPSILQKLS